MNSRKPKRPKAAWTRAFPKQAQALSPERSGSGGIKARGASEKVRMEVYVPISQMFKAANPWCQACPKIIGCDTNCARLTQDVHHKKSRTGLFLFDIRYWLPVCAECHRFIHDNPAKAIELGLTLSRG